MLSYCPSLHINYFISLPEVQGCGSLCRRCRLQELPASPFCLSWPPAAASCPSSFAALRGYTAKWITKLRHNKSIPAAPFYFWGEGVPQAVVSAVILAYCIAKYCNFPLHTHRVYTCPHFTCNTLSLVSVCTAVLEMGIKDLSSYNSVWERKRTKGTNIPFSGSQQRYTDSVICWYVWGHS